ncbi:unnamed protein product [Vitrella brassicaformis CCMP3155]|uniref:RING-type domain-containing protein n=1 Tax=Vitrella brassicaformis (strain CCMP3155) TaxID=1169540 RepID=A0A0G4FFT0_VITBC|nr:unnamed protein product [Vitrella brassicaformis CCMP3155]|eukprot:CEM12040.1 unnamed protein product [Vitrella brassicaformis CCMP3155]
MSGPSQPLPPPVDRFILVAKDGLIFPRGFPLWTFEWLRCRGRAASLRPAATAAAPSARPRFTRYIECCIVWAFVLTGRVRGPPIIGNAASTTLASGGQASSRPLSPRHTHHSHSHRHKTAAGRRRGANEGDLAAHGSVMDITDLIRFTGSSGLCVVERIIHECIKNDNETKVLSVKCHQPGRSGNLVALWEIMTSTNADWTPSLAFPRLLPRLQIKWAAGAPGDGGGDGVAGGSGTAGGEKRPSAASSAARATETQIHPCGHFGLCSPCYLRLLDHATETQQPPKCPICRSRIAFRTGTHTPTATPATSSSECSGRTSTEASDADEDAINHIAHIGYDPQYES